MTNSPNKHQCQNIAYITKTRERLDNQIRRCREVHGQINDTVDSINEKLEHLKNIQTQKPSWAISLIITILSSVTLMLAGYIMGQAAK